MRILLSFLLLAALLVAGETLPEDRGASGLWFKLKRLNQTARILYVTAHPDDEDPALLTYLTRGLGAEVTMLILNRGEGGANVVSGDFFEALGALRTVEMLRAAQYYGVEVRFTRVVDYGFSKNIGEALRQWNEEDLASDVVRIARQVRPHIVISRFNESERDGHGHHQTAGRMARRIFRDAGDSRRSGAGAPWSPLKLYTTNWREGEPVTLKIDTGEYDPVLGRSYAQMGREGYRWHRSQCMAGSVPKPGPVWAYLKLEASRTEGGEASLLSGIELDDPLPELREAKAAYSALEPHRSAPALARALAKIPAGDTRRVLVSAALAQALSLELEALVEPDTPPAGPFAQFRAVETFAVAQPGKSFPVRCQLYQRGPQKVEDVAFAWRGPVSGEAGKEPGLFRVTVAADAPATRNYWRRNNVRESTYQVDRPELVGMPLPDTGVRAVATFRYRGVPVTLETEIETSSVDSRVGAQRQTLAIGPPVSVRFDTAYGMVPLGRREYSLGVTLRNVSAEPRAGDVELRLPPGFRLLSGETKFRLEKEKEEARLRFTVALPESLSSQEYPITAVARVGGQEYTASFDPITQPGFRVAYWSAPAVHRLRAIAARVAPGLRVGYIMGSGDEVPEGLRQLGLEPELLDANALAAGDLSRYNTILMGIRAYAAREDVKQHNARLLEYVRNGGVLIVQYQTQEYDRNFGPYPYTQSRGAEETSEENAPVRVLAPTRQVFTWPNAIAAADWDNWVEQRGSKFFSTWAPEWTPLIETHDQGQAEQKGVWLEARSGKGLYVYCSLAWYRQLPFAVPGAARLVANLVSLGAPDAAWRKQ